MEPIKSQQSLKVQLGLLKAHRLGTAGGCEVQSVEWQCVTVTYLWYDSSCDKHVRVSLCELIW